MEKELNLNCFDCNKSLQDCTCIEDTIDMTDPLEQAAKEYAEMHLDVSGNLGKYLVKAVFQDGAKWQAGTVDRDIEEAAANLADPNLCKTDNWIAGANYQAERMYSEEEVKFIITEALQSVLIKVDLEQWFNQFHKKK